MAYESPFMSRRVQDQFGQMNFGAQNQSGQDSLNDWQDQYEAQQPRRDPMSGFYDSLRGAYGKTPALDEYRSFLGNAPNAADYRPGKWDRLAAGLGGIAAGLRDPAKGIEVAQGMNRSKYDYALKDYYAQAAPLKEAAGLEHQGMTDRVKAILEGQKSRQDYLDYERNLDKDYRDYLIATGKLKVDQDTLGLSREKFGYDQTKDLRDYNLDVRELNSLDKYRTGSLGVQGRQAGAAETNAASMDALRRQQIFESNMGFGKRDTVSAADLGRAEKDALGSMANDYPKGVLEYNELSDQWQIGRDVDPTTRAQIQEEARRRATARVGGSFDGSGGGGPINFGGTYNPNPPPDLPYFGPTRPGQGGSRYRGGRE